MSISTNKMN